MVSLTVILDDTIYYILKKSGNTVWVELTIVDISARGPNEFRGMSHRLREWKIIIMLHN